MHTQLQTENLSGKDHLRDTDVESWIILKLILMCGGVDWIHLAEERVCFVHVNESFGYTKVGNLIS
jgi:hypothetical protein